MEEGDHPETHEAGVEFDDIILDIRRLYDIQTLKEPCVFQTQKTEKDIYDAFNRGISKLHENDTGKKKSCATCSKKRRVQHISSIEKGQHISMPGRLFTKYVKRERKLKCMYDHHAIVKEIKSVEGTLITMVLIHFSDIDGQKRVHEETKSFDLRETELYIVDYVYPRYDPNKIVERAESNLSQNGKFKSYNLVSDNCEHFATWCVVGESESFQIQSVKQKIADVFFGMFGEGCKIAKAILRLFAFSTDDIIGGLKMAVPEIVFACTAGPYLISCIIRTILHKCNLKNGRICHSCYNTKLSDLWLRFGAFGTTSAISFVIIELVLPLIVPGAGFPLSLVLVLLSISLQVTVVKLKKALMSPFSVEKVKVTNLNQINIGDVISKRYFGFKHTSIVTNIKVNNAIPTKGQLQIVHYGLSTIFGTRTIVEDNVEVDIEKSHVYIFECKTLLTYSADVVVSRARSRIGETKWDMFSNRSCHFAHWSKVQHGSIEIFYDPSGEEIIRKLPKTNRSSFFIEQREIHSRADIRKGDVVLLKGALLGILSSIEDFDNPETRQFEIYVYTYPSWRVTLAKYAVDLDKDRLYVNVYNPALCHPMEKRAQNARKMENKKGESWTTNGFVRNCIEIK